MHSQKKTAKKIIEKQADYVLHVSGNQRTLQKTVKAKYDRDEAANYTAKQLRSHTTKKKNRFRLQTRTTMVAPETAELERKWHGLQTIGLICRIREVPDGTEQTDVSYFISSLAPTVKNHARHLRNHWSVKSTLHHNLDVAFTEDASRIRKGNGQEIIAVFRRLALPILKAGTTIKDNVRGKRLLAGWNFNNLESLSTTFQAV